MKTEKTRLEKSNNKTAKKIKKNDIEIVDKLQTTTKIENINEIDIVSENKNCDEKSKTALKNDVNPPEKENSSIDQKKKFKFPAARIKRIMQNDERVGKISTYAPILLGKATELFLVQFVKDAYKEIKLNRKVELEDFKRTIENNEKYKFLKILDDTNEKPGQ
ncbi:Class 2 transcription repressor NC2, alpha subunit (DRAP1) [Pseudoloma neurophilia]|uniref:Class 2 transcription repressor NC2, alpha subunit (DRAP1) n=1 Tax=Pseudoloma neurophilia TaxID=146866 RepID=A0A0R0M7N3_9MICR|nr:Class 2 transcription repressor NC2, alpha subunit (DRAP1) [Pseudoloma neurophilia]